LPGIGPAFAHRILAYRQRMGGFYAPEQLLEVFGIDSLRYESVARNVLADTLLLSKIHINQAGMEDLRQHPYIRWNLARAIVNYRMLHGPFHSLSDMAKLELLDKALLAKLRPYLSFQ